MHSIAGPQCVMKNHCINNSLTSFNDAKTNKSSSLFPKSLNKEQQLPRWKSVDGDCFVPVQELCIIQWSTLCVWVFLLLSTFVLGAKEAFQLMHSQKVRTTRWRYVLTVTRMF